MPRRSGTRSVHAGTEPDSQRQERPKGRQRTCHNSYSLFHERPEANLAGTVHELPWVTVQCEVSESDNGRAACTVVELAVLQIGVYLDLHRGQGEDDSYGCLDAALHLHVPQQDSRQNGQTPVRQDLNRREKEADVAVQLKVAGTLRCAP